MLVSKRNLDIHISFTQLYKGQNVAQTEDLAALKIRF